jgi:hypothetical protein
VQFARVRSHVINYPYHTLYVRSVKKLLNAFRFGDGDSLTVLLRFTTAQCSASL